MASLINTTLLYLLAFCLVFAICVECGSFRGNLSKRQISEGNNKNINHGQEKAEQHDLTDNITLSLETLDDSIENLNFSTNNSGNRNNNKRDEVSDAMSGKGAWVPVAVVRGRSFLMGNTHPECFPRKAQNFETPYFFHINLTPLISLIIFSGSIMVLRHCPAVGRSVWDLVIFAWEFPAVGFQN